VYDIHFILPITEKAPYNERLFHLKNYTFLNVQDKKVLITFLGDKKEKYKSLQNDWPPGITVEFIRYLEVGPAYKINHYLANMEKPLAKWTAKIDDDTTNDIYSLCSNFDRFYDWKKEYYLAGEINTTLEREEKHCLESLNLMDHIQGCSNLFMHEYEGCFVSWAAMNAIVANDLSKAFLLERAKIDSGYTDQALGTAAQLAKIYPIECRFLSTKPSRLHSFSLFGGKIGHIHFITKHQQPVYDYWLLMINETTGPNLNKNHITSTVFDVYYDQKKERYKFTFTKNGIIKINDKIDEWRCYWKIENNEMIFLDSDLGLNAKFEILDSSLIELNNRPQKSVKII
jgi:hypothetical protein